MCGCGASAGAPPKRGSPPAHHAPCTACSIHSRRQARSPRALAGARVRTSNRSAVPASRNSSLTPSGAAATACTRMMWACPFRKRRTCGDDTTAQLGGRVHHARDTHRSALPLGAVGVFCVQPLDSDTARRFGVPQQHNSSLSAAESGCGSRCKSLCDGGSAGRACLCRAALQQGVARRRGRRCRLRLGASRTRAVRTPVLDILHCQRTPRGG